MSETPAKKPVHLLTEAQLAALVGPRTREVYEAFSESHGLTVGEVQARLGFPSKAVYYQVKKLVEAGLLVEGSNEGRATVYHPIAELLNMPDGYQGAGYEFLAAKAVAARLRKTIRTFRTVSQRAPAEPELVDDLLIHTRHFLVSPEDFRRLKDEVRAVIATYVEKGPVTGTKKVTAIFLTMPDLDTP